MREEKEQKTIIDILSFFSEFVKQNKYYERGQSHPPLEIANTAKKKVVLARRAMR
jgi:hypothetical protein